MVLVASKPLKYEGQDLRPGDPLVPDPSPNLARQLVEHNYAHDAETDSSVRKPGSGRGKAETGPGPVEATISIEGDEKGEAVDAPEPGLAAMQAAQAKLTEQDLSEAETQKDDAEPAAPKARKAASSSKPKDTKASGSGRKATARKG